MRKLIVLVCLILMSCAGSKGDKNTGSLELPADEVTTVSDEVCEDGKVLTLMPSERLKLTSLVPAIAVISGDQSCADVRNVDDRWVNGTGRISSFKVNFPSSCVLNQSIWKLVRHEIWDGNIRFQYVNTRGDQYIQMESQEDIGATYARDHAGLRVLRCL